MPQPGLGDTGAVELDRPRQGGGAGKSCGPWRRAAEDDLHQELNPL